MNLGDFDAELVDRGFDGLTSNVRYKLINRGYKYIANKFPWLWERAVVTVTIAPGAFGVSVASGSTDVPNFRSLDHVYIVTAGHRTKLEPVADDRFFDYWLPQDLTDASSRGEPEGYYVYNGFLYVLPPPTASRDATVHYHQRVVDLVSPGNSPLTPDYLDEAIVAATLVRAHSRVHEVVLAQLAQNDLDVALDGMRVEEELEMMEEQERTIPDTGWA